MPADRSKARAVPPRATPGSRARASTRTLARRADRHALYEQSVQHPATEVARFAEFFRVLRGREPTRLREDFCGTGALAAAWCGAAPGRRAWGVDLHGPTLRYGRKRHLGGELAGRVELVQADVRTAKIPKVDVTCAMNFSFCVFKQRAELAAYLRAARRGLVSDGLLILEIYGGTEAITELSEAREHDTFTYVWEQHRFDPFTHEAVNFIHFEFPDGSALRRAFRYDWRLWTVPELRDLLAEVGFAEVRVYWERLEPDPDDPDMLIGSGDYVEARPGAEENQASWLASVVALR